MHFTVSSVVYKTDTWRFCYGTSVSFTSDNKSVYGRIQQTVQHAHIDGSNAAPMESLRTYHTVKNDR
jgi:hypothetical protein